MKDLARPGVIGLVCLYAFTPCAYAYLDPGAGDLFIQTVLAGVVGAVVILRIYWPRIRSRLFHRRRQGRPDPAAEPGDRNP